MKALARWSLFGVCGISSLYCLLCYIPFSWHNFIHAQKDPPWLYFFVSRNAFFMAAALVPAVWALPKKRLLFALAAGAAGLAVSWMLMTHRIGNDRWAFLLSLLCWLPPLTWEAFNLRDGTEAPRWADAFDEAAARARLPAALLAAFWVCAAFTAAHFQAHGLAWAGAPAAAGLAAAQSLVSHILAFLALFLACDLARAAAKLSPAERARTEAGLLAAWLALFIFWAVCRLILGALSFSGPAAWLFAALATGAAVLALAGQARDLAAARGEPVADGVDFWAGPLAALWQPLLRSLPGRLAGLLMIAASPWLIRWAIQLDWDRLIATFALLALWAAALVFFYGSLRRRPAPAGGTGRRDLAVVAAAVLLAWGSDMALTCASPHLRLAGVDAAAALHRLSEDELSLRTVRRIFRRRPAAGDFWGVLHANTNISRSVPIEPKDLALATAPPGSLARKPNLFVFIIDSLRPDYLGAYNPEAGFTPAIDSFAKEALVWRRAFTSYGATGLSEPAIWAGARLPHKQYVTPFSPMNSLERLAEEEGCRAFVTVDPILHGLLKRSPRLSPLGGQPPVSLPMACPVMAELSAGLARSGDGPVFSYVQVQDLHVSVINRQGQRSADGKSYPGFDDAYASRVAAVDACFGLFLADLKRSGLYEDSVIVLASDHGDSLGEGGRGGHAYTIFPEILRVPLIMRVPQRLLEGRAWDLDAAAFTTDITPTLYGLLGRAPRTDGEVLGRALIASSREELARTARPERPVVSSYGPVYGLLQDDGRRLYIADGVNFATYFFDLERDPKGRRNLVTPELERAGNAAILRHIEALNAFYGFRP
jgi:hypothetical protein